MKGGSILGKIIIIGKMLLEGLRIKPILLTEASQGHLFKYVASQGYVGAAV